MRITTLTFNQGYQKLAKALVRDAVVEKGRQQGGIHALHDVDLVIKNPRATVLSIPWRNMSRRYAAGELCLYLCGTDDIDAFSFYSKFWNNVTSGKRVNSAYGHRMFSNRGNTYGSDCALAQPIFATWDSKWGYALKNLIDNPDTKNAVIDMRELSDIAIDKQSDCCCTLTLAFYIKGNHLNMRVIMRSSDYWMGLPYDVFAFSRLMQIMLYEYNSRALKNVQLGHLTMTLLNLHVYEKNWNAVVMGSANNVYKGNDYYEFPEFDKKVEERAWDFLDWESKIYRNNLYDLSPDEVAARLRDAKFPPFLETLGSFLLNKIKDCWFTEEDVIQFRRCNTVCKNSACVDRKVGCVIADASGKYTAEGWNIPTKCNKACDDKIHRICAVVHAEVNALNNFVKLHPDKSPTTAWVNLYPCLPCRKALEEAGVTDIRVVGFSHKGAGGKNTIKLYDTEFYPAKNTAPLEV